MNDIDYQQVPLELKQLDRWVTWKRENRKGSLTKIPYNARNQQYPASITNPKTWSSFNLACESVARDFDGIGFVLNNDQATDLESHQDCIIGIDIDHVVGKPGGPIPQDVMEELKLLNSYCEWSPSGTGVHAFVKGSIPYNGRRRGKYEAYSHNRYFTVTGNKIDGFPSEIRENQDAIDTLFAKWFSVPTIEKVTPAKSSKLRSDDQVIELAGSARNSKKFEDLYAGMWKGYNYQSQSEADLALCQMIAFYTQDPIQIDKILRSSQLYRKKWDEKHGETTYGDRTINAALNFISESYAGKNEPLEKITEDELKDLKQKNREKEDPPLNLSLPHNLITDYVRHQQENQLSYPEFHYMSFIPHISVLTLGNAYMQWQHEKVKPVIWSLFIGDPGSTKKSTALNQSKAILEKIDPNFELTMKFPGSVEAFIEDLCGEERTKNNPILKGIGIFTQDECSRLFSKFKENRYSGIVEEMNKAFDSSFIRYSTREKKLRISIDHPFMPLCFATTPQGIGTLGYGDVGSGHLTRYIISYPLRKPPNDEDKRWKKEDPENTEILDNICKALQMRYELFKHSIVSFEMSNQDRKWYLEWENKIDNAIENASNRLPQHAGFAARLKTMPQRLAIIYHICNHNFVDQVNGQEKIDNLCKLDLDPECLREACKHIEEYFIPMIYRFVELLEQDDKSPVVKIRRIIRNAGIISRSDLLIRAANIEADRLSKITDTLEQAEEITIRITPTKGRSKMTYIWCGR